MEFDIFFQDKNSFHVIAQISVPSFHAKGNSLKTKQDKTKPTEFTM